MTSFLKFQMVTESPSGKTRTFHVTSAKAGMWLGSIAYYNQWRKYVWMPPTSDIVLDAGCLHEIADFCATETQRQRARADLVRAPSQEQSPHHD